MTTGLPTGPRRLERSPLLTRAMDARDRRSGLGTWNADVERGTSTEDRAARLAAVPEHWREAVRRHVVCCFHVKAQAHSQRHACIEPLERGR